MYEVEFIDGVEKKIFKDWNRKELKELAETLTEDEINYITTYVKDCGYWIKEAKIEFILCDYIDIVFKYYIKEDIMCPTDDFNIDDVFYTWKAIKE